MTQTKEELAKAKLAQANAERNSTVDEKLADLDTPGAMILLDPQEADLAGAFREDALSDADALEASNG